MDQPHTIALIADIHGLLPPLKAVLTEIQSNPPEEIIVAGDFLGGPQPREVLTCLLSLTPRFILGNGEINMLKMLRGSAPSTWWTHRQFDMGRWIYNNLDDKVFTFLAGLMEQMVVTSCGCPPLRVVHGAPWDVNHLIFPDENPQDLTRALMMIPEKLLVFAHNHLPGIYHSNGKLALNPGSVGNNLNGDTRASYATLTWRGGGWQPKLHYVAYDLSSVVQIFRETGFLEENRPLARAFLESILTGENTAGEYISFANQMAKASGYDGFSAVPDRVWLEAEATFPWKLDL